MEPIDPRDEIIARQARIIAQQAARIAELEKLLAKALARIADLEARLGQSSRNSSKPPSSDPPWVARPRQSPGKHRRGGQPGHARHERELLDPDRVIEVTPEGCGRCGSRRLRRTGGDPDRHQVVEIPPIRPDVTDYLRPECECLDCGARTRAELPAGVPSGGQGPRLMALVADLSGQYHLPKRSIQELLADVFGLKIATGTICKIEQRVSAAVARAVEEARAFLRDQDFVNLDESGWREANGKGWIWNGGTLDVAVYRIARSRGEDVAREILGDDFAGFLGSDRWVGYGWVDPFLRQLCWAHLCRDFAGWVERGGAGAKFGQKILDHAKVFFGWWHRVNDGSLQRSTFERRMLRVEKMVGRLLRKATRCGDAKVEGMAKKIVKLEPAIWTFARVEGVEPTNNAAERDIRPAVIWRKISFGTQSERGSRFVERILTVVGTLRKQGRNVLDYLVGTCEAALRGAPPLSLLPAHAHPVSMPP